MGSELRAARPGATPRPEPHCTRAAPTPPLRSGAVCPQACGLPSVLLPHLGRGPEPRCAEMEMIPTEPWAAPPPGRQGCAVRGVHRTTLRWALLAPRDCVSRLTRTGRGLRCGTPLS